MNSTSRKDSYKKHLQEIHPTPIKKAISTSPVVFATRNPDSPHISIKATKDDRSQIDPLDVYDPEKVHSNHVYSSQASSNDARNLISKTIEKYPSLH